jgi:hypothetical protein
MAAVSSAEFTAWLAYDRLEPFTRGEQLLAQLTALTANIHRDRKKQPIAFTADQFFTPEAARARPTQAALRVRLDAAMAAFGGRRH